uniref:Uncharacterized protein n=1 Tax=Rhizophora mucronata TaxID=61149 RepID=A0A2P2JZB2_RHIMU
MTSLTTMMTTKNHSKYIHTHTHTGRLVYSYTITYAVEQSSAPQQPFKEAAATDHPENRPPLRLLESKASFSFPPQPQVDISAFPYIDG